MQKKYLLTLFICVTSVLLHAQTRRGTSTNRKPVKINICEEFDMNIMSGGNFTPKDSVFREVNLQQLGQIEEQLKKLNICFWRQTRNGHTEECPNESKKLDKIYVFLVKSKEELSYEDGTVTSFVYTYARIVTGNLSSLLAPPPLK